MEPDLGALALDLNDVATDRSVDPSDRIVALRHRAQRIASMIDTLGPAERSRLPELQSLLGQARTYIADNDLRREAAADAAAGDLRRAREAADIREVLVSGGFASVAELDASGWPSHEQLDAAIAEGLQEETVGIFKALHPLTSLEAT